MPIQPLIDELFSNPALTGLDDDAAAKELSKQDIEVDFPGFRHGGEVMNALDPTEFEKLSELDRQTIIAMTTRHDIQLSGNDGRLLDKIFKDSPKCADAVEALRKIKISRAQELGIAHPVRKGHVYTARKEKQRRDDPAAFLKAKEDFKKANEAKKEASRLAKIERDKNKEP